MLVPCALLLFIASSCSSDSARENKTHTSAQEEDEGEVKTTTAAKVTGTMFLTNVNEIVPGHLTGRITCMVIDKADSNHLIAGAASGGLWSSYNRGRTWSPIDDQLPALDIRSISQNPLQTNTYYASTATLMLAGSVPGAYRPDIYKSTDGGQTFQLVPATAGSFSYVQRVICSPLNQNTVYALSGSFAGAGGVYRSQDGAQTFTQVYVSYGNVNDMEVLPNGTVLATEDAKIYRSTTGNAGSFTQVFDGSTGTHTFTNIDLASCEGQPNYLYGVSTGGNSGVGMFKSTDGGQSWSFLQSLPTSITTRAIGINPNNPSLFFAGSLGIYLSQNAGSSFTFYPVGGVDWWSVNFDPHNPNKVFMTFDQGISEVNLNPFNPNSYTAYVSRDSLLNALQIYGGDCFVTGDKVITGMQDLGTQQIFQGGRQNVASSDGGDCFFHKQDTTVAYGTTQNGGIFKKTNINIPFPQPGYTNPIDITNQLDANNDGTIDEGAFFINEFWMNNADGEQLYFPTKRRLWRSTNGGTSWQPASGYYDLTAPGSTTVFMGGTNKINPIVYWGVMDTVFVKANAKTTAPGNELRIKAPDKMRFIRVDPANDSIIYITSFSNGSGPRIYRSGNIFSANVQWTDLTGDLPNNIMVHCFEIDPQDSTQMVVGTNSGLYVSSNGGQHWDRDMQLPNVNILKTRVRASDNRLFIFTYGRGAWAASFPSTNGIAQHERESELKVWPNPSRGILYVSLPETNKNTSLQIWTADGRLEKTINNIQSTTASVNLSELPGGYYIIALFEGGKRVKTAKILKQ
jgi:photosystem II stability/assembly factor-like uncharacterized protein